ncbi:MAG: hypothetical protein AAF328_10280, partial [Planctomycetota bacterium]
MIEPTARILPDAARPTPEAGNRATRDAPTSFRDQLVDNFKPPIRTQPLPATELRAPPARRDAQDSANRASTDTSPASDTTRRGSESNNASPDANASASQPTDRAQTQSNEDEDADASGPDAKPDTDTPSEELDTADSEAETSADAAAGSQTQIVAQAKTAANDTLAATAAPNDGSTDDNCCNP